MKNNLQIITACTVALAFCTPMTASAATKKSSGASPSPAASAVASPAAKTTASPAASPAVKMARAIPFRGMIASVDARAKTFTIAGKEKSRVFKMTDRTVFMKNGAAATIKDVAANEEVRGSYLKLADGNLEAKTVKLGPMTEAEKAAAAQKSTSKKKKSEGAEASPNASPTTTPSPSASPKP